MFATNWIRSCVAAAVLGSLISSHVCLATPSGAWANSASDNPVGEPTLVVDPEVGAGVIEVLSSADTAAVGGVSDTVLIWSTEVTGPWGYASHSQTISDSAGSVKLNAEVSNSIVAIQYVKANGTLGFAWGIRSTANVRTKTNSGISSYQQAKIILMGNTNDLPEAIIASNTAAAFLSALPAYGQDPGSQASPPSSAGSWGNYFSCVDACFSAAHPTAFGNFLSCLSALGVATGTLSGAAFLLCLGAPPCVAANLMVIGSAAATVAGGCLAGYLASCATIALRCAWDCS